jgi:hypothetical protein
MILNIIGMNHPITKKYRKYYRQKLFIKKLSIYQLTIALSNMD